MNGLLYDIYHFLFYFPTVLLHNDTTFELILLLVISQETFKNKEI